MTHMPETEATARPAPPPDRRRFEAELLVRLQHELRTPLNAVLAYAELLQLGPHRLPPEQLDRARRIQAAGLHMLSLLEDLKEVSSIGLQRNGVAMQACSLGLVVDEVLTHLQPQAMAAGVNVQVLASARELTVWSNPRRLRQILINVLGNAIKYNRAGGQVLVSAHAEAGRAHLTVTDTGMGMTEDQLARLFTPFDRLGRERCHIEGTGLGLCICREYLEQMQGSIAVQSHPRVGTTIEIHLPLSGPSEAPTEPPCGGS